MDTVTSRQRADASPAARGGRLQAVAGRHSAKRDDELDQLRRKVHALAARRRSGVVSFVGRDDADGRSLLDLVVAAADGAAVLTASARCSPAELDLPYGVVSQLAAGLRGAGHRLPLRPLCMSRLSAAAIPWLCAEFISLARRHPLLLAVDDTQWADPASWRWLRAMTGRICHAPLLLVQATGSTRHEAAPAVDRLPPDALALIRAMAVCGDGVDFEVVVALATPRTLPVPSALGLLVRLGLVTDGDHPKLVGDAVSSAVLDGMTIPERADLARRAAELGYHAGMSSERLAELLMPAPPVHADWAAHALRRVAARRPSGGAPGSAAALLTRALREDAPAERPLVLIDLALAEAASGPSRSDRRLQQVLLDAGPELSRSVLVRAADLLQCGGDASATLRVIATAHRRTTPATADVSAEVTPLAAIGWLAADDSATDPVLPVAPALPELPTVPTDPVVAGVVAWQLSVRGRRRTRARELAKIALRATGPEAPFGPRIHACRALMFADDLVEAVQGLDDVLLDARRGKARLPAALALLERARIELLRGNLTRVAEDLESARAEVPFDAWHPRQMPWLVALEASLHLAAEHVEQAERTLSLDLPTAAAHGAGWAYLQFARGSLRMALADPKAALPLFMDCGRALAARRWTNPAVSHWRSQAAAAHAACGEPAAAGRLVRDALDRARRWDAPITLGQVHQLAARIGCVESAAHPAEPISLLGGSQLGGAAALAGPRGDRPAGLPAPTTLNNAARLTAEEERVAVLAAGGMVNAEIARHMSLSKRTLEARLTGIYRKLGLTGRRQLAEVFRPPRLAG